MWNHSFFTNGSTLEREEEENEGQEKRKITKKREKKKKKQKKREKKKKEKKKKSKTGKSSHTLSRGHEPSTYTHTPNKPTYIFFLCPFFLKVLGFFPVE
jgi:hypothetical protein